MFRPSYFPLLHHKIGRKSEYDQQLHGRAIIIQTSIPISLLMMRRNTKIEIQCHQQW
jgi:hypothetical protein